MKIIRLDDFNKRYKILKEQKILTLEEEVLKIKELQESEEKRISNLRLKAEHYHNKLLETVNSFNSISQSHNHSKEYKVLYEKHFLTFKELTLIICEQLEETIALSSEKCKAIIEHTQNKIKLYQHQESLLIHILNAHTKKNIENNKESESIIHELIDHYGELSFYNILLKVKQ